MVDGDAGRSADEGQRDAEALQSLGFETPVQEGEHHHVDHGQEAPQHHKGRDAEHGEQVDPSDGRRLFSHRPGVGLDPPPGPVPDRSPDKECCQGEGHQLVHVDVPVFASRQHLVQHDAQQDGHSDG